MLINVYCWTVKVWLLSVRVQQPKTGKIHVTPLRYTSHRKSRCCALYSGKAKNARPRPSVSTRPVMYGPQGFTGAAFMSDPFVTAYQTARVHSQSVELYRWLYVLCKLWLRPMIHCRHVKNILALSLFRVWNCVMWRLRLF